MQKNDVDREIRLLVKEKYQNQLTPQAHHDIERLKKGEHIDYVIGFVSFLGCKIDLSFKPFIPRPETEEWVKKAIEEIKVSRKQRVNCLDIFAGSGCVGIALLYHLPFVSVDFAEKEQRLLGQIHLNASLNGIKKDRYGVIQSDIFTNVPLKRYDYILANPPYIALKRKNQVQSWVIEHEPHGALFAGQDGFSFITPFLARARSYLIPGGTLYMECDPEQEEAITFQLQKIGYSYQFYPDQFGNVRYLIATSNH